MLFAIEPYERKIFDLVRESARDLGYDVYIVGGYVRDRLLNIPSKDIDIVCVGSGIRLAEQLAGKLRPVPTVVLYKRFGTAMIKHRELEIEIVGARKESYRSDSRKPIVEEGTLEDDQNRRDFTINALAVSLNERDYGSIIDPFGGLNHLKQKLIKTPLEPGKTYSDDPLRMMRAIRFACQLGFDIEYSSLQAIYKYRNRLNIVSKERIVTELNKIILSPTPGRGFKLMFETGLLEVFFPEMVELHGVETRKGIGHKDNFYHTLEVLDNLSKNTHNLWLRWSAILHDIAKPATKRFEPGIGWTFHGHEALGAAVVPRIFRRLRLPLDHKMKYVQKLVRLHLRPISLTNENITDSAIRRLLFEAGDDLEDLMLLCEADITSKNPRRVERYLQNYQLVRQKLKEIEEADRIRNWQPPIDGKLIMDTFELAPGPVIGEIKTAIREAILDGALDNTYDKAFAFMLEKGKELGLTPRKASE